MSTAKYLKIKKFDSKWFGLGWVFRIDESPYPFEFLRKRKEFKLWYNPYQAVSIEKSTSHEDWKNNLDNCYDFGVAFNNTRTWITIKIKNKK